MVCINDEGSATSDVACRERSKPGTVMSCTVQLPCECHSDSDCAGSRRACNLTTRTCQCSSGWGGELCDVPVHICDGGLVDIEGECCSGFVDVVTAQCCPKNHGVDKNGRCCLSDAIDACGVCNGAGVAVDVLGTCCESPLPASQVCCTAGGLDSCGVCAGENKCP